MRDLKILTDWYRCGKALALDIQFMNNDYYYIERIRIISHELNKFFLDFRFTYTQRQIESVIELNDSYSSEQECVDVINKFIRAQKKLKAFF